MDWFLYDNGLRYERVQDLFSKYEQIRNTADKLTFTKEILDKKLYFLCNARQF